jgi:hypothetical protein
MWCLELAASAWLGYEIVTAFSHRHFDAIQRLFCGSVLGFVLHAWVVFFLSYPFGLCPFVGILSLIIFSSLSILLHRRSPAKFIFSLTRLQMWTYAVFGFLFYVIMSCAMFESYKNTKGAGYSDMPFHLPSSIPSPLAATTSADRLGAS